MNEEQKAAAIEQMKRDKAGALTLEDLAKRELQLGTNPKWVSVKYGFPLDRCERYVRSLEQKEEAKRHRVAASSGGV